MDDHVSFQAIPIAQGIHADILLLLPPSSSSSAIPRRVLKCVTAPANGRLVSRRPHDIRHEAELLKSISHPNVVELLEYRFDPTRLEHILTLPYLPLPLSSFHLAPRTLPSTNGARPSAAELTATWAHLATGLLSALSHLHGLGIAHRDVNPANVMLSEKGEVKVVDLGTAWVVSTGYGKVERGENLMDGIKKDGYEEVDDEVWEGESEMCCQVGTGPYRAPELLFSSPTYDAPALDLWGAGVTLAELWLGRDDDVQDDDENKGGWGRVDLDSELNGESPRPTLFSSHFGDIGLAGSIFSLLGTPTEISWPSFADLPDAGKIEFVHQPGRQLSSDLTLLANTGTHAHPDPEAERVATDVRVVLTVLEGLIKLDPAQRLSATQAVTQLSALDRREVMWASIVGPQIQRAKERVDAIVRMSSV